MIPSEDNIRKTSVFVLLMLGYAYAYALAKTSPKKASDVACAALKCIFFKPFWSEIGNRF